MARFLLKAVVNDSASSTLGAFFADSNEPNARAIAVAVLRTLADRLEDGSYDDWWMEGWR